MTVERRCLVGIVIRHLVSRWPLWLLLVTTLASTKAFGEPSVDSIGDQEAVPSANEVLRRLESAAGATDPPTSMLITAKAIPSVGSGMNAMPTLKRFLVVVHGRAEYPHTTVFDITDFTPESEEFDSSQLAPCRRVMMQETDETIVILPSNSSDRIRFPRDDRTLIQSTGLAERVLQISKLTGVVVSRSLYNEKTGAEALRLRSERTTRLHGQASGRFVADLLWDGKTVKVTSLSIAYYPDSLLPPRASLVVTMKALDGNQYGDDLRSYCDSLFEEDTTKGGQVFDAIVNN